MTDEAYRTCARCRRRVRCSTWPSARGRCTGCTSRSSPTWCRASTTTRRSCARWRSGSRPRIGPDTPWHVTRFFPYLDFADVPATPLKTLRRARGDRSRGGPALRLPRQRRRSRAARTRSAPRAGPPRSSVTASPCVDDTTRDGALRELRREPQPHRRGTAMSAGRPLHPDTERAPQGCSCGSTTRVRSATWTTSASSVSRPGTTSIVVDVPFELRPSAPPEGVSARDRRAWSTRSTWPPTSRAPPRKRASSSTSPTCCPTRISHSCSGRSLATPVRRCTAPSTSVCSMRCTATGSTSVTRGCCWRSPRRPGWRGRPSETAWVDARYEERLHAFRHLAAAMGVTATPSALICNELAHRFAARRRARGSDLALPSHPRGREGGVGLSAARSGPECEALQWRGLAGALAPIATVAALYLEAKVRCLP